jgi:hypothetical protein
LSLFHVSDQGSRVASAGEWISPRHLLVVEVCSVGNELLPLFYHEVYRITIAEGPLTLLSAPG